MDRIRIKIVDAFTRKPQSGNPAGVVLDAVNLSNQQMQSIACELNLSETAFILPPTKQDADCRIRWFTPVTEVQLCGHATIASFHALAEENKMGIDKPGEYQFRLETASGILPVEVIKKPEDTLIRLGMKIKPIIKGGQPKVEMVRILNITPGEYESKMADICDGNIYVRVKRYHTLFNMKPNIVTMSYFLQTRNLQGMCVYTTETVDKDSKVHCRFFAPTQGVNEDPVTGSAHGPLAVILFKLGLLTVEEGMCRFQGEQGDTLGRRGRISVELEVDGDDPLFVKIGGYAVTVLEGDMLLDS